MRPSRHPRRGLAPRPTLAGLALLVLLALLALLSGCGGLGVPGGTARDGTTAGSSPTGPPPGVPTDAQRATIARHVDGDTLWVAVDEPGGLLPVAADHRVRFLQVDTPEVAGSPAGEECYGPEASAFTAEALPLGATVWLEVDTDPTDRFDRNLRYVWTDDGTLFNEVLVAEGYAEAVLFPPNDARIDTMRAAQRRAERSAVGLWAACPG